MKRLLGLALLLAALAFPAHAQTISAGSGSCYGNDLPPGVVILVDPVTGKCYPEKSQTSAPGVVSDNFEGTKATYSASALALNPTTSATDVFCIAANPTTTERINRIEISGTATTAGQFDAVVVRRSTLNAGGTAASSNANPANTIAIHDPSNDAASSATLTAYTANPTTLGTLNGIFRTAKIAAVTPSTAAGGTLQAWDFGTRNAKTLVLTKGSTHEVCVNLNSQTVTGGSLDINVEWTEE